MSDRFEVLVVCVGNVCRSPTAERLLRARSSALSAERAHLVSVSSAGVAAVVGSAMNDRAAAELRRLGGDPEGFAARQLTTDMLTGADLVLTATRRIRSRVLEEAPRALRRTFTLLELAALTQTFELGAAAVGRGPHDFVAEASERRGGIGVDSYDLPDPIGRSQAVHHEVAELIDHACRDIAQALTASLSTGAAATAGDTPLLSSPPED